MLRVQGLNEQFTQNNNDNKEEERKRKGVPEGVEDDDDKAANGGFGPTLRRIAVRLVEIGIAIIGRGMEARGLGNVGAMTEVGKLGPSEKKTFGEEENGK